MCECSFDLSGIRNLRRKALTFKHHAEVAALTREKADRLLDWCEETIPKTGKPKSTRELRRAVSSERRRS
jgi:hypothetical protein